jgi:hypothetical protein
MSKIWTNSLLMLSLLAGALFLLPHRAQAQGPHPEYIYALQDLRMARAYLNDGWAWEPVRQQDNQAIHEIDAAIHDIKAAAIDDGKGINDHPPFDPHMGWHDRFGQAMDRLKRAHGDIVRSQTMNESIDLRNRALRHIDAAEGTVENAWHTAQWQ